MSLQSRQKNFLNIFYKQKPIGAVDQSAMRLSMDAMIAYVRTFTLFEDVLMLCDVEFLAQAN